MTVQALNLQFGLILRCGYINKIRFSLYELMRTPPSQSSGIGLELFRDLFIMYILILDQKLQPFSLKHNF